MRERGVTTLEDAVHRITGGAARRFGLVDRGVLAPGAFADIVVFDPDTLRSEPVSVRHDMPAGGARLYNRATALDQVLVNGTEIVADGELTGATPGVVFRSGRDTRTVSTRNGLPV